MRSRQHSYNNSAPINNGKRRLTSANKNAVESPSLIARAMLQAVVTATPMYPTPKWDCSSATSRASSSNNLRSTWQMKLLSPNCAAFLAQRPVRRSASKRKENAKVAAQQSELASCTTSAKPVT
eukprot:CAMPEP_0177407886 /NCGR_PEP_ID=MMETSP0368-20130122/63367_1 /TAXON_ID=447022 ORGANISM="Scrippsiella hangoei-like, Strain SHHI-4" /NCGR_SAMPLE_ID=MMETSP0368 /ASSEMBLY_ACC=CAM_ASM_000363 /LENGTH=123 /DNA_ID=CAMNT_0018876453 /DNA_START=353 /DNA_END=720 /DNA_ORIENTATION=+